MTNDLAYSALASMTSVVPTSVDSSRFLAPGIRDNGEDVGGSRRNRPGNGAAQLSRDPRPGANVIKRFTSVIYEFL